jgi:hypothetical protein
MWLREQPNQQDLVRDAYMMTYCRLLLSHYSGEKWKAISTVYLNAQKLFTFLKNSIV